DVRSVQVVASGRGDEVAVAAAVGAEREMDVEMADAHVARFGLGTSSPPQFGHMRSSASPQAEQNVHSKEQMTASPSAATAAPQRSHSVRISSAISFSAPGRC